MTYKNICVNIIFIRNKEMEGEISQKLTFPAKKQLIRHRDWNGSQIFSKKLTIH